MTLLLYLKKVIQVNQKNDLKDLSHSDQTNGLIDLSHSIDWSKWLFSAGIGYLALNIKERMEYMHKFLLSFNMVLELFYNSISLLLYDQKMYVQEIKDGGNFRFNYISESIPNSEKVLKQKMSQMTRFDPKKCSNRPRWRPLPVWLYLGIYAEYRKCFKNKNCPKWQNMFKKMFEKTKMAATSGLAISRNLGRIAKNF
jgi:hypothetical protein